MARAAVVCIRVTSRLHRAAQWAPVLMHRYLHRCDQVGKRPVALRMYAQEYGQARVTQLQVLFLQCIAKATGHLSAIPTRR